MYMMNVLSYGTHAHKSVTHAYTQTHTHMRIHAHTDTTHTHMHTHTPIVSPQPLKERHEKQMFF